MHWSGHPPIFDDAKKVQLIAFITCDSTTCQLSWDEIAVQMGYACSGRTIKCVVHSMGYHKWVPQQKFNIWPANKSKRITWCLAQLNWTEKEWGRILWTDESSFSTAGFGHRPWVIQSAAEEYHPDCVDETFEDRKSVV